MPNPETTFLVIQCRRLMVASIRENPQAEPSEPGVERELSKLVLSRPRQLLGHLSRDGWGCSAGELKCVSPWPTGPL